MSNKNDEGGMLDLESVELVPTGKTKEPEHEFEKFGGTGVKLNAGMSLDDLRDSQMKLVYAFDESGSMFSLPDPEDPAKVFKWTPEALKLSREAVVKFLLSEEAEDATYAAQVGVDEDEDDADEEEDVPAVDETTIRGRVNVMPDTEIMKLVVDNKLHQVYNIPLQPASTNSWLRGNSPQSKMEMVKEAAGEFVRKRFEKWPQADVVVIGFDDGSRVLARGGGVGNVLEALGKLGKGGGTNIFKAVEVSIQECHRRPSAMQAHHIVLVSDGLDNSGVNVRELLPRMKELNIVFDFIFVTSVTDDARYYGEVISTLKSVCAETGGEFFEINKKSDFEAKFYLASARLMLPPGKAVK